MKTVSVREMKEIDRRAIEEFGVPALALMENAGAFTARTAEEMLAAGTKGKTLVFCGTGNNGGDGMVAARHLVSRGRPADIFLIGKREKVKGEALVNLKIAEKMALPVREITAAAQVPALEKEIRSAGLVIDAIFGTGMSGEVLDPARSVIALFNRSGVPVLAVDIPSGLEADTGRILGEAVIARVTVTFGLAKKGFFLDQGPRCTGEIKIDPIGIPSRLLE